MHRLLGTMLTLIFLVGCASQGVGERTGEKIDELVEDAGNEIEDACEKVKESVNAKDDDC